MTLDYPTLPDVCLIASGYAGEKDYVNTYLGFDRFLEINPEVNLQAVFNSNEEVDAFFTWWETETQSGYSPFIVNTTLFGKKANYGIRQISKLQHSDGKNNTVSFRAEVLFKVDDLSNKAPEALGLVTYVGEDTRDNFILLKGIDLEGDPLSFNIVLPPANGTLKGTPPNLLYTPRAGFEGSDCFNFTVSDRFQTSQYATVEIVVGGQNVATSQFEYLVGENGIRITGNYHYREGVDVNLYPIKRGIGGVVKPAELIAGTTYGVITVWSDDHRLDQTTGEITSCKVIDWGERKNYESFLADSNIQTFSTDNAIGSCNGEIFTNMFKNVTAIIPPFDTSKGIYFNGMFEGYSGDTVPLLNVSNGLYFDRMFANCTATNHGDLITSKGQYFKEMFLNSGYKCIPTIDTTNAINMVNMFGNNPNKVHPDDAEIATILTKTLWNTPTPCGITITGISFTSGSETCEVGVIGGTCTSTATYAVNTTTPAGTLSYAWYVSADSNATIIGVTTDPTLTIEKTEGSLSTVKIGCVVTDNYSGKVSDSGLFEFVHDRTYAYPILNLAGYTTPLTLSDYIEQELGTSYVGEVLINNSRVQCQLQTGDLTKYARVQLVNTGHFQAHSRADGKFTVGGWEETAIRATSQIFIDNLGIISGAGGKGGAGGVGANKTEPITTSTSPTGSLASGVYWKVRIPEQLIEIYDEAGILQKRISNTDPANYTEVILGDDGRSYTRSTLLSNGGDDVWYKWVASTTTTKLYVGGQGGAGGQGIGFGTTNKEGELGLPSNPIGGYSGGQGGQGGTWGVAGNNGDAGGGQTTDNGQAGLQAGKAIIGNSFIIWSNQGTINGDIT